MFLSNVASRMATTSPTPRADPTKIFNPSKESTIMTGDELRDARATLGEQWGLGRPLKMSEMGRALRLGGRDPGESIRDYERGTTEIKGPMSVAVELMLAGAEPPDGLTAVVKIS
jgi:hypothetical protein